jgi:mannan endo-1,4-beta-mannosidase
LRQTFIAIYGVANALGAGLWHRAAPRCTALDCAARPRLLRWIMKRFGIVLAALAAVVISLFVAIQPAQAATGIRISNGRLVEGNGNALVLRGINHAHTWYKTQTSSFANIKAAGANSVRVVLSGGRWQPADTAADVANVISLCKANRLICVLENHDTTGFGEQSGAVSLDAAVNYWISVQSALTGQENYVILNIGNEPFGNNAVTPAWPQATSSAITRLRNAGIQHTIMVDAPNWGQDWQNVMRDNAPSVLASDPTGNTIFSVHMYGVYDTAAEITSYLTSFTSRGLALCVCEFGFNHSDGNPDEDTIMSATQAAGIGNMAWSWSGNGGGVEYLDLVIGFNPAQRSSWGTRYITGANGLSTTSHEATIYGGQPPVTTTPPVSTPPVSTPPVTTPPPSTGGCSATYAQQGSNWPGGFQGGVTVRNTGTTATTGWTVTLTFSAGQRITQVWGGRTTQTASPYTITPESWNGALAPNGTATIGFLASWTGSNPAPTVSCTRTP